MATSTRVPLEVYLRNFAYEPDADYVDGEIEERPVGEDSHSAFQVAIAAWFFMKAREWNVFVRTELRIQTTATRFRVADVAILDAAISTQPVATHPPLAVFEVLSPEDRLPRILRKLGDYATMGIAEIWVVAPDKKLFQHFENGSLVERTRFSLPSINIAFDMSEITRLVR